MGEIIIKEALVEDAEELIAYIKQIGKETDNLTFGAEGLPITVEQEKIFLKNIQNDPKSVHLLAWQDGKIVGDGSLGSLPRRMSHRADMGLAVLKEAWGQGIGAKLLESLIAYAKEHGIEILNLEVRADNDRAIRLYRRYGFQSIGISPAYFKIGEEYFDFEIMVLDLR